MKNTEYILDSEEQEILEFANSHNWRQIDNFEFLKNELKNSANEHIKRKPVTIRIQTPLLNKIRAEAARKGIPYQTYIQSALFEHIERSEVVSK
jgi:predicted DNA binding CopG/RHH family protein